MHVYEVRILQMSQNIGGKVSSYLYIYLAKILE